ncbi:MAG: TM2 domain-containing protein [Ignavibacteria bacterium]|nr:TM2 domain-containing protein [Ignavibacteria bacterium]
MAKLMQLLPELEGDELVFVQGLVKDFSDEHLQQFSIVYRTRRRDPQTILLTTLIGFLGVAGVQRFIINQIGMGLLFLFTCGLCFIGTIVDLVNYRKLAFEYNQQQANQIVMMVKGS